MFSYSKVFYSFALLAVAALCASASGMEFSAIEDVTAGSRPVIASDGKGRLSVAFERSENGSRSHDIFFIRSDDGTTWTQPKNISNTEGESTRPGIAVEEDGAIDVVWCDTVFGARGSDIFFARSTDRGETWTQPMNIANTPGKSDDPALAIGPDRSIHVVWSDFAGQPANQEILYSSSRSGGEHWTNESNLQTEIISQTPGLSGEPAIAVDANNVVHVAWIDNISGKERPDVFYRQNVNGTWSERFNVSNTSGVSSHPAIACGKRDKVFLLWSDNSKKTKSPDIWCAVAGRSGHFASLFNISDTPGVSTEPTVVANAEGKVAIAWSDTSSGIDRPDIMGRVSLDNLNEFSKLLDFANTENPSRHPDVTISGDKLYLIWEEVVGGLSRVNLRSLEFKDIATGPTPEVSPVIHGVPSNSR